MLQCVPLLQHDILFNLISECLHGETPSGATAMKVSDNDNVGLLGPLFHITQVPSGWVE